MKLSDPTDRMRNVLSNEAKNEMYMRSLLRDMKKHSMEEAYKVEGIATVLPSEISGLIDDLVFVDTPNFKELLSVTRSLLLKYELYFTSFSGLIDAFVKVIPHRGIFYARLFQYLGYPTVTSPSTPIKRVYWDDCILSSLMINGIFTKDAVYKWFEDEDKRINLFSVISMLVLRRVILDKKIAQEKKISGQQPLLKKIESLQQRLDSMTGKYKEEAEKRKTAERELRKQNSELLVPLEQEIASLKADKELLSEEVKQYKEVINAISEDSDSELLSSDELLELLELPEDNVIFIGGHPRLQSKLSLDHPNWKFVQPSMLQEARGTFDIIFVYTDQLSHKMMQRTKAYITGPILYCYGTNLDRLNLSMREAYTRFMASINKFDRA